MICNAHLNDLGLASVTFTLHSVVHGCLDTCRELKLGHLIHINPSVTGPPPARPTASKPGAPAAPSGDRTVPPPGEDKPANLPKKSSGPPRLKDYLPFMKAGGNAASAIDSLNDNDLDLDMDDLDGVELPDLDVSAAPKLKDFLPFMNRGGKQAMSPSTGGK